jgi:hypothetical protein
MIRCSATAPQRGHRTRFIRTTGLLPPRSAMSAAIDARKSRWQMRQYTPQLRLAVHSVDADTNPMDHGGLVYNFGAEG